MDLRCDIDTAIGYKARSQVARRITENWCARELFCAACSSNTLNPTKNNTPSTDFVCPICCATYQVKSSTRPPKNRVVDAAYSAMLAAIRNDATPHLIVLHYTRSWSIQNALLVPRFFLTESTIERRKPLASTARRAGWVGCNILLDKVPEQGRIPFVCSGTVVTPTRVRSRFRAISTMAGLHPNQRGWLVDVMRVMDAIGRDTFDLADLYGQEKELSDLHPNNRNVRPKIRQQLQVLRDLGVIEFLGSGRYAKCERLSK